MCLGSRCLKQVAKHEGQYMIEMAETQSIREQEQRPAYQSKCHPTWALHGVASIGSSLVRVVSLPKSNTC